MPLLSLPGRAGLDLGLALSYSSQVWTRSGPYIHFDEDNGFPSPGFRLGFPTVQRKVFNAQTAKNAFLLITPAGQRIELRQVGTSNVYEAGDSSYLQLIDTSPNLSLTDPAGNPNTITYADSFSDNVNRNTFAYPTTSTDADGFSSYLQYNYDFGGAIRSRGCASTRARKAVALIRTQP